MITNKSFDQIKKFFEENGLQISVGKAPLRTFTGEQQGLGEGKYTPLLAGGMPTVKQIGRSGNEYQAFAYKNSKGVTIYIGGSSVTSPIMVLDAKTDAVKWDGKMPAHSFFRFGKLNEVGKLANQQQIAGTDTSVVYDAEEFTLSKQVQYIVPHFREETRDGRVVRIPYYEEDCDIRTVWAVADYDKFPGAGNNTSLPATE